MKYYKIICETPYCGTDSTDYLAVEDTTSMKDIEDLAQTLAIHNAESYEYLVSGWDGENFEDLTEEEINDELDAYYQDCGFSIEEITEEEYYENI